MKIVIDISKRDYDLACKYPDALIATYAHYIKDGIPFEERQRGEWILNKDENPECPFCHHSFTCWGNFCGNCGAEMRKETEK